MSFMRKRRAASREDMVVTTVALETDLHKRLLIAAIEERAALTQIVREALEEWLKKRGYNARSRR